MKKIKKIDSLINECINILSSNGISMLFSNRSLDRNTLEFISNVLSYLLDEKKKEELKEKNSD